MRRRFAVLALLIGATPAVAEPLPHFDDDTPDMTVRKRLIGMGDKPCRSPDAPSCEEDGRCCHLPEKEACSGVPSAPCNFIRTVDGKRYGAGTTGDPARFDSFQRMK